jgi:hypothetical protein
MSWIPISGLLVGVGRNKCVIIPNSEKKNHPRLSAAHTGELQYLQYRDRKHTNKPASKKPSKSLTTTNPPKFWTMPCIVVTIPHPKQILGNHKLGDSFFNSRLLGIYPN